MDPQSELVEKIANLGKLDEEFSNFMHRVNEVSELSEFDTLIKQF